MNVPATAKIADKGSTLVAYLLLLCFWRKPKLLGQIRINDFWLAYDFALKQLQSRYPEEWGMIHLTPAPNKKLIWIEVAQVVGDLKRQGLLRSNGPDLEIRFQSGPPLGRMIRDLGF